MNNADKENTTAAKGQKSTGEKARELDDRELEDVAGGISWRKKFDERTPKPNWETRDEW